MTGYTAYESPSSDALYSADSLASLTIRDSIDLLTKFPPILPDKTLRVVGWSQNVPATDNFFLARHSIPSLKDVRQFLGDQPEKFAQGYRGVVVEAKGEIMHSLSCYHSSSLSTPFHVGEVHIVHFSVGRRWSNALLFRSQMTNLSNVIETVRTHTLLDPGDLADLLQCTANVELHGLPPDLDAPQLSALYELLGENWLGERVLDACTHLVTLELQSSGSDRSDSDRPSSLFLPSIFDVQLGNAYNARHLSNTLKALRESLLADLPDIIAFTFNKRSVHWAPCVVSTKDLIVYQGDSLGWAADKAMLEKLQWFLADVTDTQGRWTEQALNVPNQGRGSGSCGIVALNAIHAFIDPSVPSWRPEDAAMHRRTWLKKLLLFHLNSVRAANEVSPWYDSHKPSAEVLSLGASEPVSCRLSRTCSSHSGRV